MHKIEENHVLPEPKKVIKKLFKKWVLGVHKNEKKYALPFGSAWVKCTPNWECIGVQRSAKKCKEVHRSAFYLQPKVDSLVWFGVVNLPRGS